MTQLSDVFGRGVSRRTLFQGAGLGAAALLLAGCSDETAGQPTAAADLSDSQKSLRIDSRITYRKSAGDDFPGLAEFSQATGIQTTYTNGVDDPSSYTAKVKKQLAAGQDIGADAVVISSWMAARWASAGYTQDIDHSLVSNFSNVHERFARVNYDPGRQATLPWAGGFIGLAWNKAAVPDGLSRVKDLWNPRLRGKVSVLSGMRETLGPILLDQDVDISEKWSDQEFAIAVATLRSNVVSGQLRAIKGTDYVTDLVTGNTVAAIARSDDIVRINREYDDQWEFALPAGGGMFWMDDLVIPVGSTHRKNVLAFAQYYYDPANAVRVSELANTVSPLALAPAELASVDEELKANRLVFPDDAQFGTVRQFRNLSQSEESEYVAQYQSVLLGA